MATARALESAKPAASGGYSYSQVEAALARVLRVDADGQEKWLRGRIQHLRRLGLTPAADGGRVRYDLEWAARWLLALRLERVGLDPADVFAFFAANWDRKPGAKLPRRSLREVVEKAHKAQADSDDVWLTVTFKDFHGFPEIGFVQPRSEERRV